MSRISNLEKAIILDSEDKMHYVYGSYEEVEAYAESVDGYVINYLDHVAPSMLQSNFEYVGKGNDPAQISRPFDYENGKVIDIEKW